MKKESLLITLSFAVGFLILAFPLFSKGMFMDGTIYAAVASNLSQGNGSLWSMKFSETLMNPFYEHPPLAIWMESVFHWLFNDSVLSERLYSLLMWFLNGMLVVKVWQELKPKSNVAWLPLLLWVMLPVVVWSFSNNMLENTMGVFVSGSVWLFLKGRSDRPWLWNGLSGAMLTLAFLAKGFVGLFPFALPVLYLIFFYTNRSLAQHLMSGVFMLLGFCILLAPFMVNQTSYDFLSTYLEHQVKNSVENVQTVPHRFKILEYFFLQVFLPLSIGLLVFFTARDKGELEGVNKKWAGLLILLSLCGVLPIMISLKQRDFYILTVYPFVVLALVMYLENGFLKFHDWMLRKVSKPMVIIIPVLLASITLAIVSTGFYKREKEIVMGVEKLAESEFYGQTFHCSNNIRYDWSTMAYLSRISKISVQRNYNSDYKISFANEVSDGEGIEFFGLNLLKRLIKNNTNNNNKP